MPRVRASFCIVFLLLIVALIVWQIYDATAAATTIGFKPQF